jgi:hypothetical protein
MGIEQGHEACVTLTRPLVDQVREYLRSQCGKLPALAKRTGVRHHAIYRIMSGEVTDPRASTLQPLLADMYIHQATQAAHEAAVAAVYGEKAYPSVMAGDGRE